MAIILTVAFSSPALAQHQDRSFIRDHIQQYHSCKTVALTKAHGNIMVYSGNGYAYDGIPTDMVELIKAYHDEDQTIKDVQISENGAWLILYGEHGYKYSGISQQLANKLEELYNQNAVFTSVSFNDVGDWIIITTAGIYTSDGDATKWFQAGLQKYGRLLSACITDDAMVAVFEHQIKYAGNVPESLIEALKKTTMKVYRVKLSGNSWFFADKQGNCQYYM